MKIWCCCCQREIDARLTDGLEIYPHRPDLGNLPFWKCDACGNYVGCHHKTDNRTKPLGNISTPEIRRARTHIHALIDPAWQSKKFRRHDIYAALSAALGRPYHTGDLRTIDEARLIYRTAARLLRKAAA